MKFYSNKTERQRKLTKKHRKIEAIETRTRKGKLHKLNNIRAMSLNYGKNVCGLITRTTNMINGLRYVSDEIMNAFFDEISKHLRSFIDIIELSYHV